MDQRRLLLTLIEPPLPFGNAASRWFYVLYNELRKRNYSVDVIVASEDQKALEKAQKMFPSNEHNMYFYEFARPKGFAQKISNFISPHKIKFSPAFNSKMQQLMANNYDLIHIEQTWAGWTGLEHIDKTVINVHHLQTIDLEFNKPKSFKEKLLYGRWFATEKKLLSKYKWIRSCSPRLEPLIKGWNKKARIKTIPVGMDPDLYNYMPDEKRQSKEPIITLIGNMGWYPSISAAQRLLKFIWPEVKKQVPNAKCRIVGWSAKKALQDFVDMPDVEILENVPDIQPYFEQASVLVYPPQRGSGMKIKILESMLFGMPVVTTSEGVEGLPAIDMQHCGIADDNTGLIERTVKVLNSPELQNTIRQQARQLVESHCSPQKTVDAMESIYNQILGEHS